ncbi:ABC transporter substrate-binding protein [Candidatus Bipolaricaulota bacterium]|nr:ABC transporter substrate-binding protein [Candidatus Bipolaricaulota bacterium]
MTTKAKERSYIFVVTSILILSMIFGSTFAVVGQGPQKGGTLRYALSEIAPSLDPHHGMGYGQITQYIAFNKLIHHDPETLKFKPELAKSWEIPDNTTYIFHLREGVTFHDGSEFNAEVLKWNFERMLSDYSQVQNRVNMIDEIEVTGPYTLKITLKSPFAPFLDNLATMGVRIVSKKAVEENGNEYIQSHPVGTGPFKFENWDKQKNTLTFTRYENYWGENAYLDEWQFVEIPEPQTRLAALRTGDVDILHSTPQANIEELKKSDKYKLVSWMASSNTIDYITFNCEKPPMEDVRVRKAIALALDEPKIVQFLDNVEPIYGPLPPASWGSPPNASDPGYNPERAKELLAEAGYPDGFSVTLKIWSDDPLRKNLATVTQSMLAEVGVDVNIKILQTSTLIEQMRNSGGKGADGEWTLASLHWGGGGALDPNGNLRVLFHSENGQFNWISNFKNEKLDNLLDEALLVTDRDERQQLYYKAFNILKENYPMIWFGRIAGYKTIAKYVHGIEPLAPTGYFTANTANVWIER